MHVVFHNVNYHGDYRENLHLFMLLWLPQIYVLDRLGGEP